MQACPPIFMAGLSAFGGIINSYTKVRNQMLSKIKIFLFVVCSFVFIQCTDHSKENKLENIDPISSFKELITNHLNSYKNDKREKIVLLGGGWVKEYYDPENDYKIDIQKTNSLITPNTGYFEFTLTRHYTAFHKNKNDAMNDTIYLKSDKTIHKHRYGFQENKWVVTSREHQRIDSLLPDWYDCNEILQEGEQKGMSNIEGCWEK